MNARHLYGFVADQSCHNWPMSIAGLFDATKLLAVARPKKIAVPEMLISPRHRLKFF